MISPLSPYFAKYHFNAILITNRFNVRYLTGFTGTNGLVLITPKKQFFFTDSRYLEQARREVRKVYKVHQVHQDLMAEIGVWLKKLRVKKLGFEAETVSYSHYLRLKKKLKGVTLVPITEDPAEMRMIKTKAEIKKLEKALQINKLAFEEIRSQIKPGVREVDAALALEFALRKHGAEKLAFDTIIASGWRGALPHGKASEKKLKAGELVTIDFGGVYQGYHADETITLCLGEPTAKQKEIYQVVLDAQKYAMDQVRPGVKCSDIDKAARAYITKKGYGQYFGHALGHGVGLEIHERPVLSPKSENVLEEGMVFTIEPGIYIPGWGGVRIEDVVECTQNNYRILTKVLKRYEL